MKFIDRRLNPLRLFAAYGSLLIDKARNGCNGYPRFPRDIEMERTYRGMAEKALPLRPQLMPRREEGCKDGNRDFLI